MKAQNPFPDSSSLILAEGAMIERIRRECDHPLHPTLLHALFFYESQTRKALERIYEEYIDVAEAASLPILLLSPTRRASRQRVHDAGAPETLNRDALLFLESIRAKHAHSQIYIGAMCGCANDAYDPKTSLSREEAHRFHDWQIAELAESRADCILFSTNPALPEVLGAADLLARQEKPFILSFVVRRDGRLLDGTPLWQAMETIDGALPRAPLGYGVNCTHPANLLTGALMFPDKIALLKKRLIFFQGNASRLQPEELEGRSTLESESPLRLASATRDLVHVLEPRIVGGCCGTDARHLKAIAHALTAPEPGHIRGQ